MKPTQIIQGNTFTLLINLQADGSAYNALASADSVTLILESLDRQSSTTATDSDGVVFLNTPSTGSIQWNLTSAVTDALALGTYNLYVQVATGASRLEWPDLNAIQIIDQRIS